MKSVRQSSPGGRWRQPIARTAGYRVYCGAYTAGLRARFQESLARGYDVTSMLPLGLVEATTYGKDVTSITETSATAFRSSPNCCKSIPFRPIFPRTDMMSLTSFVPLADRSLVFN